MKKHSIAAILFLFGFLPQALPLDAPVTTAPVITACPGSTITVPVTVTNFNAIGSVSLTLKYNPAVLTYVSAANTSGFPGLIFGHGIAGKVVISGFAGNGITYPDNTVLFTLTLGYVSGTTALSWYDVGSTCEYTGFPGYFTLNDIPASTFYINGQVGPQFDVNFTADNLVPGIGQPVAFTDQTSGGPTSWAWSFSPASVTFLNGTGAGTQNPQVTFNVNGPVAVTLAATSGGCTISRTVADYIHSGTAGLWTGLTSADWNTASNWHNYLVPGTTTDVVIPPATSHWPVYDGDLTIGATISNLTLQGATSMMTVTGNLVIAPAK